MRADHHPADRLAGALALLYLLDRLLKLLAVRHFFRRPAPPAPPHWPAVALLCPITRSPNDLRHALEQRVQLSYPGPLHLILICDAADQASQAICRALIAAYPQRRITLVTVTPDSGVLASKIHKLRAGLAHIDQACAILGFVDDDVALRTDSLQVLVPAVMQPDSGAVFGLACYSAWNTLPESLMSGFVNTNALLSYLPLSYLCEPFTITGHCFALRRQVFEAIGGLEAMQNRIDDDHELARRVRRHGLRNLQTPLIYDVENRLASIGAYHEQIRRWMRLPRETMLPTMSRRERAVMACTSLGNLLPPLLALLALVRRSRRSLAALGLSLTLFIAVQHQLERAYLQRTMPSERRWLLPVLALLTPLHMLAAALGKRPIHWRGQILEVERSGRFRVVETPE